MKVIDQIKNAKKPLFTFELLPPLKGNDINTIYKAIDPLMEFKPAYINMTCHSHEVEYKTRADGLHEKKVTLKRPGTVAISAAIKYKYKEWSKDAKVKTGTHDIFIICNQADKDEVVERIMKRQELEKRQDDSEAVVRNRLNVYREQTSPLGEYYNQKSILKKIDGMGSIEDISGRINEVLLAIVE